jgi:aconitate hydratase
MSEVVPAISGPKRPQDLVALTDARSAFRREMEETFKRPLNKDITVKGEDYTLSSGDVVIASITSCTNTSNPYVMIGAGLVAKKAAALGITRKPWVKTSLAPGSQVVSAYLEAAGLQEELDKIGFNLVGYGCTTCIGNSGPLQPEISQAIAEGDLVATSVLSGNRNLRAVSLLMCAPITSPLRLSWSSMRLQARWDIDISKDPITQTADGKDVYLKDLWPSTEEIAALVEKTVTRAAFQEKYAAVFKGDEKWQAVKTSTAKPMIGHQPQPMCKIRPTSKTCLKRPAQSRISKTQRCSPSSAIWSQPTTSPPLAASRKRHLQGNILQATACPRVNSTPTARAAATTKS